MTTLPVTCRDEAAGDEAADSDAVYDDFYDDDFCLTNGLVGEALAISSASPKNFFQAISDTACDAPPELVGEAVSARRAPVGPVSRVSGVGPVSPMGPVGRVSPVGPVSPVSSTSPVHIRS